MDRWDQLSRYFRERLAEIRRAGATQQKRAVPYWFLEALRLYKRERGSTFTKQQLRNFIRARIRKNVADETVARYIRYAVENGYVKKLKEKKKGVYIIVFK